MSDRLSGDDDSRTRPVEYDLFTQNPERADALPHRVPAAARGDRDVHVAGRNSLDVGGVTQQRLQMMHLA